MQHVASLTCAAGCLQLTHPLPPPPDSPRSLSQTQMLPPASQSLNDWSLSLALAPMQATERGQCLVATPTLHCLCWTHWALPNRHQQDRNAHSDQDRDLHIAHDLYMLGAASVACAALTVSPVCLASMSCRAEASAHASRCPHPASVGSCTQD